MNVTVSGIRDFILEEEMMVSGFNIFLIGTEMTMSVLCRSTVDCEVGEDNLGKKIIIWMSVSNPREVPYLRLKTVLF